MSIEKQDVENVLVKDDTQSSGVFIKLINPLLAKIVGSVASVLFQHISYWSKTQKTNVVFRTNDELVSDLQGMYSASQIQYAKKKLIDNGMIEVSFNKGKKSWDRTTHYSITEKGKQYLINSKGDSSVENTPKHSDSEHSKAPSSNDNGASATTVSADKEVPKTSVKGSVSKPSVPKHTTSAQGNNAAACTKEMQESFAKGFSNENATKCPDNLLEKMKGLLKKKKPVEIVADDVSDDRTHVDYDEFHFNQSMLDSSDNPDLFVDYDAQAELDVLNSVSNSVSNKSVSRINVANGSLCEGNVDQLPLDSLMKKCFTKGTTAEQEELFAMQQYKYSFVEDY